MIPYPLPDTPSEPLEMGKKRGHHKFPLEVALTPFHLAMVFYDRLRIICTVNQQLVYEDTYDQVASLSCMHQNLFVVFTNEYFLKYHAEFRRASRINMRWKE